MIKVLLPASKIPLDSIVTKRTGEKKYILKDKIIIFNKPDTDTKNTVIKAEDGSRFLISEDYNNIVSHDTILCWITSKKDLLIYLENELKDISS